MAQLPYRGQRTTCGNQLYFSFHHAGPRSWHQSGRFGGNTFTPWAPSLAQVFSFSHGLLLGALSLVLKQKPSGERRKRWVAKYDLIPHRMRVISWDFPWMCPTQPAPACAADLQSLERRQRSLIPTFLSPFLKMINELISISYFASHGWLQTLLRTHFPYQSGSSFEQKDKSQENGLLLIQETGYRFSGNRVLVKNGLCRLSSHWWLGQA